MLLLGNLKVGFASILHLEKMHHQQNVAVNYGSVLSTCSSLFCYNHCWGDPGEGSTSGGTPPGVHSPPSRFHPCGLVLLLRAGHPSEKWQVALWNAPAHSDKRLCGSFSK